MTNLILTIGDKNLSSWSMRPWILMTQAGIPFTEENIQLDRPESRRLLREKTPAGLVPALHHGDVEVWDSLSIAEYLAETHPDKALWPAEPRARAFARSISAEMHSGFSALRTVWPMNFLRLGLQHLTTGGVQRDIDRIDHIWTTARREFGDGGDFLFGEFSIADAMYAPVVSRLLTYGPTEVSKTAQRYIETISSLRAYREWGDGAAAETGA
ncbi:MAG: glutathione S-transferase family protein [Pseudomonadota bacterium]